MMPTTVPIPPWNADGLLPAADVANPTSATRSPYPVALGDFQMEGISSN